MLNLPARITHDDAAALARSLASQVSAQSGDVVIQAGQLVEFDSSAVAVLLACRRAALAAGKGVSVAGLPDKLAQLSTLYGVGQLLEPGASSS